MSSGIDAAWDPANLLGAAGTGDSITRLLDIARPEGRVVGWATVELDRAEREIAAAVDAQNRTVSDLPDDALLGATGRLLELGDGRELVLLEPSTEGPLAAALARHGEGPLALYL